MTPFTTIFDQATGQEITREMTADEIAQYQSDVAQAQLEADKRNARVVAKQSAIAKLEALGLTEDEAKAIIG